MTGIRRGAAVRSRRGLLAGLVLLGLVAAAPSTPSQAAPPRTQDTAVDTDNPGGEPQVAVNPRDSRNIVVGKNVAGVAYTRDGGVTWTPVRIPNLGDNVLATLPDGTFLYSSIDGAVYASRDGGATWPQVGNWVGAIASTLYQAFPDVGYPGSAAWGQVMRNVACNAPAVVGAGPLGTGPDEPGVQLLGCDRPWLATDPHTGRAYLSFAVHSDASGGASPTSGPTGALSAAGCRANNGSSPFACGRQYVSASGDGGRTWSTFRPMDSAEYPFAVTQGWSGGPTAAFGRLATSYAATGPGCSATCVVFATSTDDGQTWVRRVVGPISFPTSASGLSTSLNFSPYTAADPSRRGSYAVVHFDAAQRDLIVHVTRDHGASWRRTVLAEPGAGVNRWTPWVAFGPTGALGVTWRTSYADGSFDAWAAVSPGGDTRFQAPVRLSSGRSPGPVATGGDDNSDIVLTATTLWAVWGDQRGGPAPTGWFGSAFDYVGSYRFSSGPERGAGPNGRPPTRS